MRSFVLVSAPTILTLLFRVPCRKKTFAKFEIFFRCSKIFCSVTELESGLELDPARIEL